MGFIFDTKTAMKRYNRDKYWIDNDYIRTFKSNASTLSEALKEYQSFCPCDISDTALKRKSPMYRDTEDGCVQVGYVITGATDFEDHYGNWSKQYIELWVEIDKVESAF